uniref:Uncharacterized protein n=1 Tax=Manihot esculenta TaxID=3983 RepID=A0A2C9W3N3_MANES
MEPTLAFARLMEDVHKFPHQSLCISQPHLVEWGVTKAWFLCYEDWCCLIGGSIECEPC